MSAAIHALKNGASTFDFDPQFRILRSLATDIDGMVKKGVVSADLVEWVCAQLGIRRVDAMSGPALLFTRRVLKDRKLSRETPSSQEGLSKPLGPTPRDKLPNPSCHADLPSCQARNRTECKHWCNNARCNFEVCVNRRRGGRRDGRDRDRRDDRDQRRDERSRSPKPRGGPSRR